ncbi:MAG: hypothetical protein SCALA702_25180 [Melioribacteraceae bacterium]|nr:MAG: hypothetical protein SCALA702_25180 [Melioribacteraceae bacterium]
MKHVIQIALWELKQKFARRSYLYITLLTPLILIFLIRFTTGGVSDRGTSPATIGIYNTSENFLKGFRNLSTNFGTYDNVQPDLIPINLGTLSAVDNYSEIDSILAKGIVDYVLLKNENEFQLFSKLFRRPSLISKIEMFASLSLSQSQHGVQLKPQNIFFETVDVNTGTNYSTVDFLKNTITIYLLPIIFVFVVVFAGNSFIRGFAQERQGRILEILLSSCSRNELFYGKIAGLLLATLVHLFIWWIVAKLFLESDFSFLTHTPLLGSLFFILGFLLYTALFIGLSGIITTENEAQHISSNLSLFLIIPLIFTTHVIASPNSILSSVLTYIPFTSPPVMLIKIQTESYTNNELIISAVILVISCLLLIKLAVRYFNNGLENLPNQ